MNTITRTRPGLQEIMGQRPAPAQPQPLPLHKEKGQIWQVSCRLLDWVGEQDPAPLLLPVVLAGPPRQIHGLSVVECIQLHYLHEAAATDDLVCPPSPGRILDQAVLPVWAKRTMATAHLECFLGTMPGDLLRELTALLEREKNDTILVRQHTGLSAVTGVADFRWSARDQIMHNCAVLSAPVTCYLALYQQFKELEARFVEAAINGTLEAAAKAAHSEQDTLCARSIVDTLLESVHTVPLYETQNQELALTAGRQDLAVLATAAIERELSGLKKLYQPGTPEHFSRTTDLLLSWFAARPDFAAVALIQREIDTLAAA